MLNSDEELIIVGAGPTGLGCAWRLQELGWKNWRLCESTQSVGGLASSVVDAAGFTWDLGGHVLFSHYDYFDELMDTLLGEQWVEHQREAWIRMRDRWIAYPLQHNFHRLPKEEILSAFEGLFEAQSSPVPHEPPRNFREWLLRTFGKGLCESFMLPYNRKVWAYDPMVLDVGWMGERVANVDPLRVIRHLVSQTDDVSWGPNRTFRCPLSGGTGRIWEETYRRLPQEKVLFQKRLVALDTNRREIRFADGDTARYDRLISTIPLDQLLAAITDRPDLSERSQSFTHSSTNIVGVGFRGQVPTDLETKCWIYFPEANSEFYRVTVFSNYSPNNVPEPGQQWSLMAEISESPEKPVDQANLIPDTIEGFRRSGLIGNHEQIESVWSHRMEYGYPTPWLGRDQVLAPIDAELRAAGIYSRGRFGAWKYEVSNQDHALIQGVEAVDHLLCDDPEMTYHKPSVVNSRKNALPHRNRSRLVSLGRGAR